MYFSPQLFWIKAQVTLCWALLTFGRDWSAKHTNAQRKRLFQSWEGTWRIICISVMNCWLFFVSQPLWVRGSCFSIAYQYLTTLAMDKIIQPVFEKVLQLLSQAKAPKFCFSWMKHGVVNFISKRIKTLFVNFASTKSREMAEMAIRSAFYFLCFVFRLMTLCMDLFPVIVNAKSPASMQR